MITTLTLNPCIDYTVQVDKLEIGGTNRINKTLRQVGGKGINVATVLSGLGQQVCSLIFSYEQESVGVEDELRSRGMKCKCVKVPGKLRTNIKVFDMSRREMSEFNESGSPVSNKAVEDMLCLLREQLDKTDILVVDGSVPPGVPEDFYRKVIELARERKIPSILDADNGLFREGLKAGPTLIKPNLNELQKYLGRNLNSEEEILNAAEGLLSQGIVYVCVSAGENGAYLVCREGAYYTKGAPVEVRGVQGAGDSLVAGFSIALLEKREPEEMLRLAVACADGSLLHEGTGMCGKEDLEYLLPLVSVTRKKPPENP